MQKNYTEGAVRFCILFWILCKTKWFFSVCQNIENFDFRICIASHSASPSRGWEVVQGGDSSTDCRVSSSFQIFSKTSAKLADPQQKPTDYEKWWTVLQVHLQPGAGEDPPSQSELPTEEADWWANTSVINPDIIFPKKKVKMTNLSAAGQTQHMDTDETDSSPAPKRRIIDMGQKVT